MSAAAQAVSAPRCYFCGTAEGVAQVHPHNWLCSECRPVGEHVVNHSTASDGGSLAVCQCGWRSQVSGKRRRIVQDAKVRLHRAEAIARAARAYDAEFGDGAAVRSLAGGLAAIVLLAFAVTGLVAAWPGGGL